MEKMPMCIALDLDGTTLDHQGNLSKENRKAIEYAISLGVHIIIASGRAFQSLPKSVTEIPGIEYAVTSNGASVCQVLTGEKLQNYMIEKKVIHKILELTQDEEIVYEAFIDGHAYADIAYVNDPVRYGASPEAVEYVKGTRQFVEDMPAFMKAHAGELESMDIVVRNLELKKRICNKLECISDKIYLTSSVDQLVEIADKNAGKASGLRYLKEHLQIPREHMAAFGNADNDIDMIEYAGYGYAVENASDNCKRAADYIVRSNDQDGAAQGIYEFLEYMKNKELL